MSDVHAAESLSAHRVGNALHPTVDATTGLLDRDEKQVFVTDGPRPPAGERGAKRGVFGLEMSQIWKPVSTWNAQHVPRRRGPSL
jgi:hypothetical protein